MFLKATVCCLFLCLASTLLSRAQVRLVEDINPASTGSWYEKTYSLHESDGARSYFVANGTELWTSDGTTAGTKILKRFLQISELEVMGSFCFFSALTEDHGHELWISNGSFGGTVLLKDIYPGRGSSTPTNMIKMGDVLYFSANDPVNGRELWKSSIYLSETVLVKDIAPGSAGSSPKDLEVVGNKLFFNATTSTYGAELWASDGTSGGTYLVKDIVSGSGNSNPGQLTANNGWLFFAASDASGRQLWKSNGTAAGTTMVKNIYPGADAQISHMTAANGIVFFGATEPAHGYEVWRSDGTTAGTYLLADVTPGPGSETGYATPHLERFTRIGNKLVFLAYNDGMFIWISDGTVGGTKKATYPNGEYMYYIRTTFHEINGAAYFRANINSGTHLFKMDMNGIVYQVRSNIGGSGFEDVTFSRIGLNHYFISGEYYWKTDGTSSGTTRIRTLGFPAGSNPENLADVNGTLYFSTRHPDELWKSNGTAETTDKVMAVDYVEHLFGYNNVLLMGGYNLTIVDEAGSSTHLGYLGWPRRFTNTNTLAFFTADTDAEGEELWSTDGTAAGTRLVKDIYPGTGSSTTRDLTAVGNYLYFTASNGTHGQELWRTNGTTETYLVNDIIPGSTGSAPYHMIAFKGKLYFQANNGTHGNELWQSNGSNTLTTMLKDIRTGDGDALDMGEMIATTDYFYFTALNQEGQTSLWRSDGTTAGTVQMRAFGTTTQLPLKVASIANQAFFMVPYAERLELWRVSGTTSVRLANFRNQTFQNYDYLESRVAVKNNTVYFVMNSYGNLNSTLWRTDGTFGGTYQIQFDGYPVSVFASGNHVYLSGISQKQGHELFVIEEATSTSGEDVVKVYEDVTSEEAVRTYPNPFAGAMTLRVAGEQNEKFDMKLLDVHGKVVSVDANLECNTDHQVGQALPNGMYIVQIKKNNGLITRKIMKGE
jgi:ELWxxDGT repeat protein